MIVKMSILRLLGSSDDKEKRGVARPEGQNELTGAITEKVCGQGFYTGLTDVEENAYVGALPNEDRGKIPTPDEPTLRKLYTSVHW